MAKKIIISGGGTGGHIFPAIAIARALKSQAPDTEILFVGALGRMEMEKVPEAGFDIVGLHIRGIDRSSLAKNVRLPFLLLKSIAKARSILKHFQPDVVVGVGGYASGPLLLAARRAGIPYLIQEQNSYAGLTNKRLGARASKICVAFDGMDRFFPKDRLLVTGNPIRRDAVQIQGKRAEALEFFELEADKPILLVTGGSLGARTLNDCLRAGLPSLLEAGIQLIWQCGSHYYNDLKQYEQKKVRIFPFLQRMDLAYALADLIISRAGAGTIAELCVIGKPVILVPSPNVAEDHQTRNAQALVEKEAAVLVADQHAATQLVDTVLDLMTDRAGLQHLSAQISKLARIDADSVIANEVLKLAESAV